MFRKDYTLIYLFLINTAYANHSTCTGLLHTIRIESKQSKTLNNKLGTILTDFLIFFTNAQSIQSK